MVFIMKACAPGMCEGRRCWLPTLTGLRPHPPRVCRGEGRCFHLVALLCHLYHIASRTCYLLRKERWEEAADSQWAWSGGYHRHPARTEVMASPTCQGGSKHRQQGDIFSPTICATRINTEVVHVSHGQGQPTRVFYLRKESKALVANI